MIRLRNIVLVFRDQLPLPRLWRNLRNGNLRGLLHPRSHSNHDGSPKVRYNTKVTAIRSAEQMAKKRGVYFSNYKCLRCDGYHIGKNQ